MPAGRAVWRSVGSRRNSPTLMRQELRFGSCGGGCACATCHVYVGEKWAGLTGKASDQEEDMLDFAYKVQPNSRLSCQIKVTPELDGLVVTTPDRQG